MTTSMQIDELDADLIIALSENPRLSATELAQRFRVSRNTVHARLARLSDAGIIAGFTVRVQLPEIGLSVEAFVDVELAQGALHAVIDALEGKPNVLEVHATTGRADLMVRVAASSHAELQHLLEEMYELGGVNRTTTHITLSTPVRYRVAPLLAQLTRASGRGRAGP